MSINIQYITVYYFKATTRQYLDNCGYLTYDSGAILEHIMGDYIKESGMFSECVREFAAGLRRKGYSEKTVSAYRFDLAKLAAFTGEKNGCGADAVEIGQVDRQTIRQWLDRCLEKGNKARTISRKASTCKAFFDFLADEGLMEENPADGISIPKTGKRAPTALTQDEIRQLMSAPAPDGPFFLRDRAVLALLYGTGIRVGELVSITMEQVFLDRQVIHIKGKGARERLLPLPGAARRRLIDYFSFLEKEYPDRVSPRAPAFTTKTGRRMTVRMIQYMVEKYGREAGIISHVHPHLIRHSIASHLIEEGCSVEAVRQTLGHEDLATTSIYLKTASKFLKEEHRKYNPTDRLSD